MPNSTYTGPYNKIVLGRDFNFFNKVTVTGSSFATSCDMIITFTTQGVMMLNEGTGIVEYSFNGNHVHGELDSAGPTRGITFDNRVVSKIWFRLQTGSSIVVSVQAWATT